jgi:hypothetical protein
MLAKPWHVAALMSAITASAAGVLVAESAREPSQAAPAQPPSIDPSHKTRSPATLAAPSAVPASNPALRQLARERAALELVDHAAQQALQDATKRVAAMHAYVQKNNLATQFSQYSRTFSASGAQITFQTALDRAMDHLASRPIDPPSTDLQHLEQAVQVENGAAHASFVQLNAARRAAELCASFLASIGQLGQYQEWASKHPANARNDSAVLSDPGQLAAAHDRRAVQLGWDSAQQAQAQQFPPTPDPGQAVAHGPYSSSWWNSYADPYYDLAGYPGRDPSLQPGAPSPDYGSTGAPINYAWATQGYSRQYMPMYSELGPNVVPAFGMFPTGAAGGRGFGGVGGMGGGGGGGAAGGGR